jgi:hypothetical protein
MKIFIHTALRTGSVAQAVEHLLCPEFKPQSHKKTKNKTKKKNNALRL